MKKLKEWLVLTGLMVNNVELEVMLLQDPPAFVSVTMSFEIAGNVIISKSRKRSSCKNYKAYVFLCTTCGNGSESIQILLSTESKRIFP